MERSSSTHEGILGQTCQGPSRETDLAILGQSRAACETPLHPNSPENSSRPCGPVTTGNVLRLLERQQYRCALTGRQLTPDTASLDHVVPVRCGGKHLVENTQVLHKDVNRSKTTMTNEEFIRLCREVVEYTFLTKSEGEAI